MKNPIPGHSQYFAQSLDVYAGIVVVVVEEVASGGLRGRRSPKSSRDDTPVPDKEVLTVRELKPEFEVRTSLSGEFKGADAESTSEDSLYAMPLRSQCLTSLSTTKRKLIVDILKQPFVLYRRRLRWPASGGGHIAASA